MRIKRFGVIAGVIAAAMIASGTLAAVATQRTLAATPTHATSGAPRYQHIFYIMMENQAYNEIIGNTTDAPHLNALANEYGLATNYYGVTHPSEPNYVASIGGSFYSVTATTSSSSVDFSGDNPYYCFVGNAAPNCAGTTGDHQINAPNLGSQLEDAGLTWKTYQQNIPSVGFTGASSSNGGVDGSAMYAAKHNPFLNFLAYYGPAPTSPDTADGGSWTPNPAQQAELNKMVPDTQLALDLENGSVPNFAYIVPDQCHDMHGTKGCTDETERVQAGDTYVGQTVNMIMSSKTWREGNNAIVITWDENDYSSAGCASNVSIASIGCQVPTIVVTNHGPRGVVDTTPYNHYALLLTIEDAFHLGCLANSCPATGGVQPMTPLFRASGQ